MRLATDFKNVAEGTT